MQVSVVDREPLTAPFPPKLWTRKASLRSEVIEARQVLVGLQFCCKE